MQTEIDSINMVVAVSILGINQIGSSSGNASACQGKDLPWLQDTADAQVWNEWQVNYRDVVIIDENNEHLLTYNLTDHDLSNQASYDELMALLVGYGSGK